MNSHVDRDSTGRRVFLDLVVPVYNEMGNVRAFYEEVCTVLDGQGFEFRFIFINDGSRDNTQAELQKLTEISDSVEYVELTRNFGKEAAITAGLDICGDGPVVILDGDMQHPPEIIITFMELWAEGWENIYGMRENRVNEGFLVRYVKGIFYKVINMEQPLGIANGAGDFRLLGVAAVKTVRALRERNRFMKGLYPWSGHASIGVPYRVRERRRGQSRWSWIKLIRLAVDGITSFTTFPLRVITVMGLVVTVVAAGLAFYELGLALGAGIAVPGYTTTLLSVIFLGGVQLLALGVIAEYVGKIFVETKSRPIYVVARSTLDGDH